MEKPIPLNPDHHAVDTGFTYKHTRKGNTLDFPPSWYGIKLGQHPILPSESWVIFDERWFGETLNPHEDTSYSHALADSRREESENPDDVKVLVGSEITVVLRRSASLGYSLEESSSNSS